MREVADTCATLRYRERTKGPKGTPGTSFELSSLEASPPGVAVAGMVLVDCSYE